MDKNEIIERLEEIAKHVVHTIGEEPFIMSLDDGIAIHEAIDIIQQSRSQRTGHWIDGKCNRCGTHAPYWVMASTYYCSNYCSNCGAYMVTEEEM